MQRPVEAEQFANNNVPFQAVQPEVQTYLSFQSLFLFSFLSFSFLHFVRTWSRVSALICSRKGALPDSSAAAAIFGDLAYFVTCLFCLQRTKFSPLAQSKDALSCLFLWRYTASEIFFVAQTYGGNISWRDDSCCIAPVAALSSRKSEARILTRLESEGARARTRVDVQQRW